jgi:hypothetical protein
MPVFEKLEPPAGGLAGLRDKVEHSRRKRRARAALWVMVPAACTAVVALWMRPFPPDPRLLWKDVQNPALVRLGMQPRLFAEVQGQGGATVMQLDGVYWVGAVGGEKEPAPADEER